MTWEILPSPSSLCLLPCPLHSFSLQKYIPGSFTLESDREQRPEKAERYERQLRASLTRCPTPRAPWQCTTGSTGMRTAIQVSSRSDTRLTSFGYRSQQTSQSAKTQVMSRTPRRSHPVRSRYLHLLFLCLTNLPNATDLFPPCSCTSLLYLLQPGKWEGNQAQPWNRVDQQADMPQQPRRSFGDHAGYFFPLPALAQFTRQNINGPHNPVEYIYSLLPSLLTVVLPLSLQRLFRALNTNCVSRWACVSFTEVLGLLWKLLQLLRLFSRCNMNDRWLAWKWPVIFNATAVSAMYDAPPAYACRTPNIIVQISAPGVVAEVTHA